MSRIIDIDNAFSPSPYRISTITATGSLNTELDLDVLFDSFNDMIKENGVGKTDEHVLGLIYVEFGKKRSFTYYQHFSKKFVMQRKKQHTSKRFDNQLTIIYKYSQDSCINLKVFKNGNIQMTGVKTIDDGRLMIDKIVDFIKDIGRLEKNKDVSVVQDMSALRNNNYKVALINSDFKVDFEIKRDRLYSILINYYNNKCSFEPCIYPGVKIQFFWNIIHKVKDGVCRCREDCHAIKGEGTGENDCKKITIAVFQSGCIIITGAQTTNQIDDAYVYICNVLKTHLEVIKKVPIQAPKQIPEEPKPKVILKKNLIIYPSSYINNTGKNKK